MTSSSLRNSSTDPKQPPPKLVCSPCAYPHLSLPHTLLTILQLRKLAFKIINSSTILLPAWKEILTELGLRIKLLPRDVRTRWNSTYDMLVSALEHRDVIDKMFKNEEVLAEVEPYELSRHEWKCAEQLRDALEVSHAA